MYGCYKKKKKNLKSTNDLKQEKTMVAMVITGSF